MKFIISGKNIEVTEGIKAAIEEKLGRLDKYLVDDTIVNVTLSVQKGRQKIEVTIPMKGHIIRAEEGSEDMYVSIDLVVDVIERQIRRYKTRLMNQKYDGTSFKQEFMEQEDDVEDDEIRIIIPHCTINEDSIKIKSSDLKIYDTNFAIMSIDKEAVIEVVAEAEEKAKKKAESDEYGFLDNADENAKKVIKGMFENVAGERKVVVEFK